MRRKSLTWALAASVASVFLVPNAAAAVKAGATCSKAGIKSVSAGKTYTCVKSGKKLVWNKGVVIPVAKPSPAASAAPAPSASAGPAKVSFIPWATSFVTEDMTLAALASTSKYLGDVKPSSAYKLVLDPAITDSDRAWITKMLDYTNGAFTDVLQGRITVYLGTTHTWSAAAMRAAGQWVGDPNGPYPCSDGTRDAYCAGENIALMIYSDIYKPNSNYRWDVGRRSTPAHELFHNVQFALGGRNLGPEDPAHIPRWLMEGSASYFGYYMVEKLGLDTYSNGRGQQVTFNRAYKSVVPLAQYDDFASDPYGIGLAATEYLIASIGFENFLNIWKYTKSEGTFAKGFAKATGIELNDFYTKFEAARGSMKIGSL